MEPMQFVNKSALIAFTKQLIQIPSLSGQEEQIATCVASEMEKVGFDQIFMDEKHNVFGILEGAGQGRDLLFLAHSDHADVGRMEDPYSGKEQDGAIFGNKGRVIYGRGACDMKGALASMIHTVDAIKRSNIRLDGDVKVLIFTLEELGIGEGLEYAVKNWNLSADMAISGEATNLNVYIGHRGSMQFKLAAKGRTCHASNPARGINAIFQMNKILTQLQQSYEMPTHPFLGDATFTILDINAEPGGVTPIVPDRCEIILDRRYFPHETSEQLEEELQVIIKKLQEKEPEVEAEVTLYKVSRPLLCNPEEEIVKSLQKARQQVLGTPSKLGAWMFGIDIFAIEDVGIPCVGLGPGNELFAHSPQDHVPLSDLVAATKIYVKTATDVCAANTRSGG
jgi:succinyl-diaminopimelate desuccinylase